MLLKFKFLCGGFIAVLAGCASVNIDLPPITDTQTDVRHSGKIVWRDLLTNKPAESRRFYEELFGWTFERPGTVPGFGGPDSYLLIRHEGRLIGGMLDTNTIRPGEDISQWMTGMSVADLDTAVARVEAQGGKINAPPTSVGSRGRIAVIEDPTGALFAMIEASGGDPDDSDPVANGWLWDELWTEDVDTATTFYQAVVGFEYTDHDIDQNEDYRVLTIDNTPRAGVLQMPFDDVRPVWVNYVRVEDPAAVTARVAGLGGEVLVESQQRRIGGTVALIAGPSGAGLAIQTWPLELGD